MGSIYRMYINESDPQNDPECRFPMLIEGDLLEARDASLTWLWHRARDRIFLPFRRHTGHGIILTPNIQHSLKPDHINEFPQPVGQAGSHTIYVCRTNGTH